MRPEHHSNLVSIASHLRHLRTQETDPCDIDGRDAQLDAIMRVIEGREPHVLTSINEHLWRAQSTCEPLDIRPGSVVSGGVRAPQGVVGRTPRDSYVGGAFCCARGYESTIRLACTM